MAIEFKLPEIGEGTAEGEIIKWLVAVGDEVVEDTPLVEVMTDKATVEVPSPQAGTVLELKAQEGEIVDVGAVIMLFGNGETAAAPEAAAVESEASEPEASESEASEPEAAVEAARAMARAELEKPGDRVPQKAWEAPAPGVGRVLSAPATRRLAREMAVDLLAVPGTGKGGRVTKGDVMAFAERGVASVAAAAAELAPAAAPTTPTEIAPAAASPPASPPPAAVARAAGSEERIPVRGLRRLIVARMREAKNIIPHFTYVEECDMTEVVALRRQAKALGAPHDIKVTYLPFFIQALIAALKKHPILNSSFDEDAGEIVLKRYYNIGIATASERGLIVPVVKNADHQSVFELAREIDRVATQARDGKSQLEDLQGGTFTITSTGNIGGVLATPIINHPEVAILGVTAIRRRPVVRGDDIVIRDMVNLSLSLDHRIVDGYDGAVFLRDMIAFLEDPKLLLLGDL